MTLLAMWWNPLVRRLRYLYRWMPSIACVGGGAILRMLLQLWDFENRIRLILDMLLTMELMLKPKPQHLHRQKVVKLKSISYGFAIGVD
jgi:hypothetical protein